MIPDFNDDGYLPPGVHPATLEEHGRGDLMAELKNETELENTREKLRILEEQYGAAQARSGGDEHVRRLTLHSLKKLINQLTEEIIRFEAHMKSPTRT
jgi:hypothetical protein